MTSKDNVINETDFQFIQSSVSKEGLSLLVTLGLKPHENKRKKFLFAKTELFCNKSFIIYAKLKQTNKQEKPTHPPTNDCIWVQK